MKKKEAVFTPEDIELLARTIGRPAPADVRASVMAKIDEINREAITEKSKTPSKTPERDPKRKAPNGRDGID